MQDLISQLDEVDQVGLDGIGTPVAEVDGAGHVSRCNRALAGLAGTQVAEAIGRDLFRDLLPSAGVPAFRGRFLEGVRRSHLDERFRFVFGLEAAPLAAAVHMAGSRRPGHHWIVLEPLGSLAPSLHRSAALAVAAVERRIRAEPIDPVVCEREPIHTPGAVQPHAVLLVCDAARAPLVILACSENVGDLGGDATPAAIVGRPLHDLLPPDLVARLGTLAATPAQDDTVRAPGRTVRLGSTPFWMQAHVQGGRLLIELERVPEYPDDFDLVGPQDAQDAVARLRRAGSLPAAATSIAESIRDMTGFERVLVYRFDTDWNGVAMAEARVADWDASLLGLRFPASDIPAQARALYARSPARFVVDRDAVPAGIRMDATGPSPIDLSHAHARALSPVHLEYQRNLGVNGSMSVSIMVEGALWGLVIGHHRRPHYVTPATRALTGLLTDAFALCVHELETARIWQGQQATLAAQNRLLEQMARSDDFTTALTGDGDGGGGAATLMDLFSSGGAMVAGDGRIAVVGTVPPADALPGLVDWLRWDLGLGHRVFSTDNLAGCYPAAAAWPGVASGLLAVFIGDGVGPNARTHLLLWFRPEVATSVVWGGDPSKPVLADERTRTVLPRRSFERWVEERRGHALAWASWEIGAAEALGAAIEGVILRQGRRILALEAQGAALTAALEQKDVLAREIDHRVKNSLQIVASVMLMQGRAVSDPAAKAAFEDTYGRVMSVARVHASLQQSDDSRQVDLGQTLRQLCDDLTAGMGGTTRRLDVQAEPGLMVFSQTAVALSLVATELVTNALKYAYAPDEPGQVEVSVRSRTAGGVELRICDGGRGLPADWSDRAKVSGGRGGLGMRVIRAMLQQIGAEMQVGSTRPGACFTVLA